MQVKVLTLPYRRGLAGFDEAPLARFLDGKEVVRLAEHFFSVDDEPHLACLVVWQPANGCASGAPVPSPGAAPAGTPRKGRERRSESAAELDAAGSALRDKLRAWRAERARSLGVPAYRVLTNRQLDALASRRPASLDALRSLEGIGPATVQTHGEALLALVRGVAG